MTNYEKYVRIDEYFARLFPNAHCELNYTKDYELVIAVMLSAQTTDKAVNKVTSVLFSEYKSLDELHNASLRDIENIIQSIGLYKNKAKNIVGIVDSLIKNFDYKVPNDKDLLMSLPGIGNKSAGVIRAEVFKIPDLPVDTHVARVSKRLDLASNKDDPLTIERKLKKMIPEDKWISSHHRFIYFGRYFCFSQSPKCHECELKDICKNQK